MLVDRMATGDFRGKRADDKNAAADKAGKEDDDENAAPSGIALFVDVNGSGKFDVRGEDFDIAKPFNIGGTTYEIEGMKPDGSEFKIVKSSKTVAEIPTPPDHRVGHKITPFEAQNMDGKTVNFPGDYKGKVVMLDFWATWCGPCMKEVPGLVETYKNYHAKGFEVLGVTLDNADATDKINDVTKKREMSWPQIYDGKGWKARIADLYVIRGIPSAFLVDGDSGEIIATGGSLRGGDLDGTIKDALEKKVKPAARP
jgi:thiol-disulfide isomerase/thioredoxin